MKLAAHVSLLALNAREFTDSMEELALYLTRAIARTCDFGSNLAIAAIQGDTAAAAAPPPQQRAAQDALVNRDGSRRAERATTLVTSAHVCPAEQTDNFGVIWAREGQNLLN